MESLFLSAFENSIKSTANRGGKKRYIPLNAVYTKNRTTYKNGVIGFL